jgi:hypothetical protein
VFSATGSQEIFADVVSISQLFNGSSLPRTSHGAKTTSFATQFHLDDTPDPGHVHIARFLSHRHKFKILSILPSSLHRLQRSTVEYFFQHPPGSSSWFRSSHAQGRDAHGNTSVFLHASLTVGRGSEFVCPGSPCY